jgi:hypothetical protein
MPSSDERTTGDQDRPQWNDAEESTADSSEQTREREERSGFGAPSTPQPSWQPETPAWDRPTPRSESTAMPLGGPIEGAATTPSTKTAARKTTTRKSPKRVAAGKKAATARKRKTSAARKKSATTRKRTTARKASSRRAR